MIESNFYKGKNVLVTGHTGFKGTWLCNILTYYGANVVGYSLDPPTSPSLYAISETDKRIKSIIGDIRDIQKLKSVFEEYHPEVVFHLAAQPIVRVGYADPVFTYETNVMGTVNVLECVRMSDSVRSVIVVTTDKVYFNREWEWGYRENEMLNGYDPYSNSKSCAELVTDCYKRSFFNEGKVAVSTMRAGNVIGGGDYAKDRIIPDCVRAMNEGKAIKVRNPYSIRPYQHVLEPLFAYLLVAEKQYSDRKYIGSYNVGPDENGCVSTGKLVDIFCQKWGCGSKWENCGEENAPHEANFLKLDCSMMKSTFSWAPKWEIEKGVEMTCDFYKGIMAGNKVADLLMQQIDMYIGE